MQEFLAKCGPLIWVLGVFSVYGLAVVMERLFYFHRIRINIEDLLRGISQLIKNHSYAEALHEVSRAPGAASRVIESAIARHDLPRSDLKDIIQEAGQLEVPKVEKNIRGLLVVATVTPLIGMLGTLFGLIKFYGSVEVSAGRVTPVSVSQGIFEALTICAASLAIAIPSYLFYMFLAAKARVILREAERAGIEIVNMICDTRANRDQAGFL